MSFGFFVWKFLKVTVAFEQYLKIQVFSCKKSAQCRSKIANLLEAHCAQNEMSKANEN